MSNPKELSLQRERKGEKNIKVERLFNMFLRISERGGNSNGEDWLKPMYTYLPRDEREKMNDNILNNKRIKEAKDLVGSLKEFAEKEDDSNKRGYSRLELNNNYLKILADLEIKDEAFKLWKKREIKLGKSPIADWFLIIFEEMDDNEIDKWKNRIERRHNNGGKPEDTKLLLTTIFDIEEEQRKMYSELDKKSNLLGKKSAKEMQEKEGIATVFLKDREASVKSQLDSWYFSMPNNDLIEEEVEMIRAKEGYYKRIIVELQGKDQGKQKV